MTHHRRAHAAPASPAGLAFALGAAAVIVTLTATAKLIAALWRI